MDCTIITASDKKWIFESALDWMNLTFQVCRPVNSFSNFPKQSFTRARTNKEEPIIEFKPGDIKDCILDKLCNTLSLYTATVCMPLG